MNNLEILKVNKNKLLFLEALGWLHDYQKCADEFLVKQSSNYNKLSVSNQREETLYNNIKNYINNLSFFQNYLEITNIKSGNGKPLKSKIIELLNVSVKKYNEIIKELLVWYLSRCHNTSHFDKQEPEGGQQVYPGTKISTPFGFEKDVPRDLTLRLQAVPWADLDPEKYDENVRSKLLAYLEENFSLALGDNRRPINEVDLWGWGYLVGSLYKSALAGILLKGVAPENARDLKWRLLSVRVDGLAYLCRALRLPDLLARYELLTEALKRIRYLLEVEYPLGSEVYRDENGSIFVVPCLDKENLLEMKNNDKVSLKELIKEAFVKNKAKAERSLEEELCPEITLEEKGWYGQDPEYHSKSKKNMPLIDELPRIAVMLSNKPVNKADPALIEKYWQEEGTADVCSVCGLRPQSRLGKVSRPAVCKECRERREKRAKNWADSINSNSNNNSRRGTVWTEEVADRHGRLALVVGKFYLEPWLNGTNLESLLMIPPHKNKPVAAKNPSFSRLRRIWMTTKQFFAEIEQEITAKLCLERPRLKIYLKPGVKIAHLELYNAYDLRLGPAELDVVLLGDKNSLLSASNLTYVASRLGAEDKNCLSPQAAALFVKEQLLKYDSEGLSLFNQERGGSLEETKLGKNAIKEIKCISTKYSPTISILTEPQTFMLLVPAENSLDVLRGIKEKYEKEMGRVRDRLPLKLGVIYGGRRTPLRALLEAGRYMLEAPFLTESWTVKSLEKKDQTIELKLQRKCKTLAWSLPLYMGDGITADEWYPYVILDRGNDCSLDYVKRRQFEREIVSIKGNKEKYIFVHMADLKEGERVLISPSTFDFEFIDHNARRFEVAYDGLRRRLRPTRPYYLEELTRLEQLWSVLKKFSSSQLRQIIFRLETIREEWYGRKGWEESLKDPVFRQFVRDTLAGADWPKGESWQDLLPEEKDLLLDASILGELSDLAELYLEILKG